jgi:hypothetical protein
MGLRLLLRFEQAKPADAPPAPGIPPWGKATWGVRDGIRWLGPLTPFFLSLTGGFLDRFGQIAQRLSRSNRSGDHERLLPTFLRG